MDELNLTFAFLVRFIQEIIASKVSLNFGCEVGSHLHPCGASASLVLICAPRNMMSDFILTDGRLVLTYVRIRSFYHSDGFHLSCVFWSNHEVGSHLLTISN